MIESITKNLLAATSSGTHVLSLPAIQQQRRKTKKRQWLQKMYELGKKEEQGGGSDGAWRLLTEGVGPGGGDAGNGSAPKQPEDDDELDDGLEEMLKWSDSLDFESYYQGWLGLATSARPEWSGEAVAY